MIVASDGEVQQRRHPPRHFEIGIAVVDPRSHRLR